MRDISEFTYLIPVKYNSQRVPYKNIKKFYSNNSLLDIKIKQLLKHIPSEQIMVLAAGSGLDEIMHAHPVKYITVGLETEETFTQHMEKCSNSIETKYLCRCTTTMPYFNGTMIIEATKKFMASEKNSLILGEKMRGHYVNESFEPLNFSKSGQHQLSQDIPFLHSLKPGILILEKELGKKFSRTDLDFIFEEVSPPYSIDINYKDEWSYAQRLLELPGLKDQMFQ